MNTLRGPHQCRQMPCMKQLMDLMHDQERGNPQQRPLGHTGRASLGTWVKSLPSIETQRRTNSAFSFIFRQTSASA